MLYMWVCVYRHRAYVNGGHIFSGLKMFQVDVAT
jgi:hypothetical protein